MGSPTQPRHPNPSRAAPHSHFAPFSPPPTRECTRALEANLTYEEVIAEWEKIDDNANGTIDRVEFATWWQDYKNRIPEASMARHQRPAPPKKPARPANTEVEVEVRRQSVKYKGNRRASAEALQEAWEDQFRQATRPVRRGYNPRVFL